VTTTPTDPRPPGAMGWEEAVAAVTGPGQRFELVDATVDGVDQRVFANAPASLRSLFEACRNHGDATFLVYEDERWSFEQFMAQVDAWARVLVEAYGIEAGDRVAIAMRNYPEWVVSFAAAVSVGAVAVCLNAWWTGEELAYGLEDSGATLLVADPERAAAAHGACSTLGVRCAVVRAAPDAALPQGCDRVDDLVAVAGGARSPGLPAVAVGPDDDAMILYTSGTTGHPKGAVSTHRAVTHALMAFGCRSQVNARYAPPREPHPFPTSFILVVPLFHVTGLVPVMLSCVVGGYTLVVMYKWDPTRALELIEREQVTQFVGVPTQSWDLLESPDFADRDTSSLLSVGGGGAPAPPELVQRVEHSFSRGRPSIGYGMTETNAYGPGNSGDDYVRKPRSTGRVVPVMQIAVRDEEGRDVPTGEIGEIWFKGPNLIRGYWDKPEATAETIVDGWLRTGDLGRLDDEGFVYVEDRAKDMVLRAGENVYSAEVEAVVYELDAVYECAVFGVPHERLGEEVACAVYPRPGAALDVEELRAHVARHLAAFKVPSRVFVVDEQLPRGATGKILKRELRDRVTATP
jgi:long-chain acyl-CoA synthetase